TGSQAGITVRAATNVWHQASAADFSAGAYSGTALAGAGGGVRLPPSFGDGFGGAALAPAWTRTVLSTGGTATVSGGVPAPVSGGFRFSIDGVAKATLSGAIPSGTPLKLALRSRSSSALRADWVLVDRYRSGGTFTSAVFDAGALASWGTASWAARLPAGTT